MVKKIKLSIEKFKLDLSGKVILTEAASGNYVITPIIAAIAGARVIAITRNSKFATVEEVEKQTFDLAKIFNVQNMITIITDKNKVDYKSFDIVTNTGFVRPIDKNIINKLSTNCVIPLMWEPWEFRESDLDLDYCNKKGIKVYGTNESDDRLQTIKYIGFTVLSFLLDNKMTPFSTKILVLGNTDFANPVNSLLKANGYDIHYVNDYISQYQAIVIIENEDDTLLIGKKGLLETSSLIDSQYLIHICGNVDFKYIKCKVNTNTPANFGFMSFTTDYIDNQAVIDLHTAGLKVAEGMIVANSKDLSKKEYKKYMEDNYPALSFNEKRYW